MKHLDDWEDPMAIKEMEKIIGVQKECKITFKNGTEVYFDPSEDKEKLQGLNLDIPYMK